jgi:hypothetical protein
MREEIIKVYKYDELTEQAKDRALEKLADINTDHDWWDYDGLLDVNQKKWIKYGLKDCLFTYDSIYFGLYQDRHLEFKNLRVTDDNVFRQALGISSELWKRISYYFTTEKACFREDNTTLEFELEDWEDELTPEENVVLQDAIDTFKDWRQTAEYQLQKNYEYLTSREAIEETIRCNEYDFTEDGKMF